MPKYYVTHLVDPPIPMDRFKKNLYKCKAQLTLDASWIRSWLQVNENQEVIHNSCEWDAKNLESIRESLSSSLPEVLSTLQIFPMVEVEAEDYR